MTELKTAGYIRTNTTRPSRHDAVKDPIPFLKSDENYGDLGFHMSWKCITQPYVDEAESHYHDFNQYLVFLGGNPHDMLDLGGQVELTLSEDGVNFEKHVFTRFTTVFIRAGLYHCPLVFTRVDRPFVFYNYALTKQYVKKS
ncbi:MAG TPA: hypothetical protein VLH15_04995 [Dehalococcoidales bacterium]|nr:hypothetical protein [Dehalococcoidales bacterium]